MGRPRKYDPNQILKRNCPICEKEIIYSSRYAMYEAQRRNRKCQKCGCGWSKNQTKETNESLKKMGETVSTILKAKFISGKLAPWNKELTKENSNILKEMGERHRGFKHSEETKKIIGNRSKELWEQGHFDNQYGKNRTEFKKYQNRVHKLTKKIKHLIEGYDEKKHGKMGILGAYQIDHIIDIKYGFDNNISPEKIADISNLRFIPWEENIKKGYYGKSKN